MPYIVEWDKWQKPESNRTKLMFTNLITKVSHGCGYIGLIVGLTLALSVILG